MMKKNVKRTAVLANEILKDVNNSLYTQWYLMSLDITDSKIHKSAPQVKKMLLPKII